MKVVIDKDTLKRHRACRAAYSSPEWDEEKQALIYSDWNATISRLLARPGGLDMIEWFVNHKLVPMTEAEFEMLKKKHGGSK